MNIEIDLAAGYRPHFKPGFTGRYGAQSPFVNAAADCLTARHVRLLIRHGALPEDTAPLQLGSTAARESLEALLDCLQAQGLANPVVILLQSAFGSADAAAFENQAAPLLGAQQFATWLAELQRGDTGNADMLLRQLGKPV
jgi:hypothetical protein